MESDLADLWRTLLDIDQVGRNDSFFALGGNSLKSLQVLNRIKSVFGVVISVRDFFGDPTIAALAQIIEQTLAEQLAELSEEDAAALLANEEKTP